MTNKTGKLFIGEVVSDKMQKTAVVAVDTTATAVVAVDTTAAADTTKK
jgi:ribosomal protein S17